MALQHLRSSTADKRPTPAAMSDGQLALNTNLVSPGLFFKDSNGDSVKIGPVHVGTTAPNVTPGAGGQAGNSKGEAWLDTTAANPILKVFNGTAFVAVQPVGTGTVVSTTDTGTVTSTMILDGTILNADINASAAIAGTKVSPDFGSQTVTTTGVISSALGAAATPSLTFTGDLNTGVFSPGADQVAISTNGTSRLHITSGGLVGIGTSAPSDALHLASGNFRLTNGAAFATANSLIRSISSFAGSANQFETTRISSLTGAFANRGEIAFSTGDDTSTCVEKVRIDHLGRVGIGTTSPVAPLHVDTSGGDGLRITTASAQAGTVAVFAVVGISNGYQITNDASNNINHIWSNASGERARIDSSGRLLVGTSTARSNFFNTTLTTGIQVEGTGGSTARGALSVVNNDSTNNPALLILGRSGTASLSSNTVVADGDWIGTLSFQGADGTEFVEAASVTAYVDGTPGANDMPGRLVFSTTADGSASPTERIRIDNAGRTNFFCSGNDAFQVRSSSAAGTSNTVFVGRHSASNTLDGSTCILILTNGNVVNTNNSYGSLSDIKLKENIVDSGSQWNDLKALQVRKYNFKEGQTHTQIGLIAQEVELVSPGLVSESPDRDTEGNDLGTVTKSVNYSVLYMKAVKALQEAMERIEQLETSNADLLARVIALETA